MTAPRHPFLDHPRPVAVAHRGGALEAEENTMEAFARAVDLGFTHVETDVHATRDGVVVIHHDPTFERMTGEPARIADLDWVDIARIRTRRGAAIPRAEEVLAAFPDLNITFELKCDRVAAPLADVITRADALSRVSVGSFAQRRMAAIRGLLGPRSLLVAGAVGGAGAVARRVWPADPPPRFCRRPSSSRLPGCSGRHRAADPRGRGAGDRVQVWCRSGRSMMRHR
jgi:glycerophosphoryl diester phosphodiesterase